MATYRSKNSKLLVYTRPKVYSILFYSSVLYQRSNFTERGNDKEANTPKQEFRIENHRSSSESYHARQLAFVHPTTAAGMS